MTGSPTEWGNKFGRETAVVNVHSYTHYCSGVKHGVDYVALSYVGSPADILELREEIRKYDVEIPIIAKIERKEALENINEIIEVSDAIMIARGDLGEAMPLEKMPFIERMLIRKAKEVNMPVITATQMMLSMTQNPQPTRA